MEETLDQVYDQLFKVIHEKFSDDLAQARKQYDEQAGVVPEEFVEEYENKMTSFNEWFLFDYKRSWDDSQRMLHRATEFISLVEPLKHSLAQTTRAVFELLKNKPKKIVLRNLLINKKLTLAREHSPLSLLEGDLFIGRIMDYQDATYMMKGVTLLPTEIKPFIKKKVKEINKQKIDMSPEEFLLTLEAKKSKSLHFKHVPVKEIFVF